MFVHVLHQIIDEEDTQFMTNCPPAVTESTPRRRTSIQVYWTAPPGGSGCISLKYVAADNRLKASKAQYMQYVFNNSQTTII